MKFLLTLVICSGVAGECMPRYEWPKRFSGMYDCLQFGYAESSKKLEEIGKIEVDKYLMHIKFYCQPVQET